MHWEDSYREKMCCLLHFVQRTKTYSLAHHTICTSQENWWAFDTVYRLKSETTLCRLFLRENWRWSYLTFTMTCITIAGLKNTRRTNSYLVHKSLKIFLRREISFNYVKKKSHWILSLAFAISNLTPLFLPL
jgi:hypothetical protein